MGAYINGDYKSEYSGDQIDAAIGKVRTPDSTPTASSDNLVTSGGVKAALDQKQAVINDLSTIRQGASDGTAALAATTEIEQVMAQGYKYYGVATPNTNPGTLEQKVFYIASQPGTYTNLGGIVVNEGEVCTLMWNETSWSKQVTGAATAAQVSQLGQYIENPEWVKVVTDREDKILYGVKTDGKFYFGDGCPPQVQEYVHAQIDAIGVDALLATKVDKVAGKSLIDSEVADSIHCIENNEYIEVKTDSEGRMIEAIDSEGKKVFVPTEIEGTKISTLTNKKNTILNKEDILSNLDFIADVQEDISLLDSSRRDVTPDIVTLNLVSSSKKKLLLNLHKSNGVNMKQFNNVYLPNAAIDFSDVKVKDQNNNILPYHIISRMDLDFIQPIGLPDTPILANSHGELFAGDTSKGLVFSNDNGITWSLMSQFSDLFNTQAYAVYVDDEDTLFFSSPSKLYKSAYPYSSAQMVLDLTDATDYNQATGSSLPYLTGCYVFTENFVKFGDAYYCAGYQNENWIRIYKSTDGGTTWELVFSYIHSVAGEEGDFQHIHHMHVDNINSPNAIYAGCDRKGHVFKSTDGSNWSDIKTTSWENSTDQGVFFVGNGFRLLGGETSIKGGHSIQRTTDDVALTPVLNIGHGCYMAAKLSNHILVGAVASNDYRSSGIYCSDDNGNTWNLVYAIPRISGNGASDGFRYIYPTTIGEENVIFAGCQGYDNSLIIKDGYFSQILVDIPNGCSQITIESGYLKGNIKSVYNDIKESDIIVDFPFNENENYILERVSSSIHNGNFKWGNIGKNIGDITPRLTPSIDKKCLILNKQIEGFKVNDVDLSGGFHIGFWTNLKSGNIWKLLTINGHNITINGYQLRIDGSYLNIVTIGSPITSETLDRYDINIASDGSITAFKNGEMKESDVNASVLLKEGDVTLCDMQGSISEVPIQHLVISTTQITQQDAINLYYAGLNDNH